MKIGDTVRLAGGGPVMTVVGWEPNRLVQCAWFIDGSRSEKPSRADFPEASLLDAPPATGNWKKTA